MSCGTCNDNGSRPGDVLYDAPCAPPRKADCGPSGYTAAGTKVYTSNGALPAGTRLRDPCTGQTKVMLPYVNARKQEYDCLAVKVCPRPVNPCVPPPQPCQQRLCCPPERRTQCYDLPPRRSDCYSGDPKGWKLLYLDGFDSFNISQCDTAQWNWFTNGKFVANDGQLPRVNAKGLTLNAKVFKKTYLPDEGECEAGPTENGFFDHFKTFAILNSDFALPDCGQVYAEACMAARMYGLDCHSFGDAVTNAQGDMRLAYSAFSMIDLASGLHIAHVLTNDQHLALYEVLPLDQDEADPSAACGGGGKASFAGAYFLGRRDTVNPLNDFARLGLALDKRKGATWYINGVEILNISRLGFPPKHENTLYHFQGQPAEIMPRCVHIGFGHFTMLDGMPVETDKVNPDRAVGLVRLTNLPYVNALRPNKEVRFVVDDNSRQYRNFGQGAILNVKEVKVEYRC